MTEPTSKTSRPSTTRTPAVGSRPRAGVRRGAAPLGRWSAAPGLALLVGGLLVADASTAGTVTPAGRLAALQATAGANRIDGLNMVEGEDGTTTVRLKGSARPTYNVYRLQGPDRLVVDVSDGARGQVVPRVALDTWAVAQVSVDEVTEGGANLVRVTFGLKRDASYIVVPDGNDLVVTVTPREVPPEAYFARKSASKRRSEIQRAESRVSQLEAHAAALQAQARAQVSQAEARAKAARAAERRAREAEARARAELEGAKHGRGKVRRALREAEKERAAAEKVRKEAEAALREALARAARQRKEAAQMHADARRKLAQADHTLKLARAKKSRVDQALAQANASKAAASRALSDAARKRQEAEHALAQAQRTLAEARKAREEAERAAKRRATRRTREALARAQEAESNARSQRQRADRELAAARAEVAKLREQAAQDREAARASRDAAEADKRRAQQSLAEARAAKARAQKALAEAQRVRQEAEQAAKKRASRRTREALARAQAAEVAAKRQREQADRELANARAEVAKLREQATRDRRAAAQDKRHAEEVLAEATLAMEQARAEKQAAARARKEAEAALARARAAARKGKADKGKSDKARAERKEIERALTQAKQAELAARRRFDQAQKNLAALRADRARLAKMLEEQRKLNAKLVASRAKERAAREADRADRDKAERAQLARVRKEISAESEKLRRLEKRVLGAQRELDERLARLEAERAAGEQRHLGQEWKKARKAAGRTTIRDVRFEDTARASKVLVRYDGPVEYEGAQLTPNVFMLRLSDAKIAKELERSLDASSYAGPIQTITSFGEGDQVKILVSTREDVRPKVHEGKGTLVWTFPRSQPAPKPRAVSMAGSKVGGYAKAPAPLMAAASPASPSAAPSSSGRAPRRARRGRRGKWRGERIDIELQDAPIKDVLLLFSDIGRVNIIAGQGVSGSVTMKLTAVPWDQALDIILRSLGLGMVREGNVIRVATQQAIDEERRKAVEAAAARVQLKPLETRLVPVSYATVDEMIPKVQSVLSPRGSVTPDSRTNTLIIMDVAENIALAEQLVGQLDSQTPQVLIEARIVEARTSFLRQLGIQWGLGFIASPGTGNPTGLLFPNSIGIGGGASGRPPDTRGLLLPGVAQNPNYAVDLPAPIGTGAGGALGFSFGNISGNLQTNLRLSAAENTGEVRIISAPKIVTLDNNEAQIEQGVQIPISQVSAQGVNTRYVRATLGLRVTPHVTNEGAVLLEVNVQKNEADFVNTGARGDPTILTKQAESRMLVNDGDTAVIGGIYTRNKSVNFKKVPWIADIPIIGWFFKNKTEADTRTEVLIFLTPKIVNRASSIGG